MRDARCARARCVRAHGRAGVPERVPACLRACVGVWLWVGVGAWVWVRGWAVSMCVCVSLCFLLLRQHGNAANFQHLWVNVSLFGFWAAKSLVIMVSGTLLLTRRL